MNKITISTGHPDAGRVYSEAYDAALAREAVLREELEESDAVVTKLSTLLAGVAIALRGPELELHRHGYNGLPELISALQQRLTVAEQRAAELTASLQLATRLLNASKSNLKPTGKLGKAIRDFLNSRHKEDVAKLRGFFSTKSTDNSEDEQDQRLGFVRMNTKTDQPRISMADMHARYERKPCQETQAHPTRCECEDLSHDQ